MTASPVASVALKLRSASAGDEQLFLTWRNDPLAIKNSGNPQPVSPEEHGAWFRAALADPGRLFFVAESQGNAVGMVRADKEGTEWILSWSVDAGMRGRGLGARMVAMLVEKLEGTVCARIRGENLPSLKIAKAVGMREVDRDESMTYWKLTRPSGGARA
ncbi:MAG: GNAT family N-acetyltransferase [Alphaproteobacteria bacterium]|nr:GNAT family N-acetyltransferase [Alphaproteobacteria bacterium]